MGRKFVRMSLGGIHDEAEIRGHRRTYIGALPGRIIQSIKTAGSNNPVFMLDEVDKIGMDFRGDPSSALLEVLDPEQNNTFQDNYLEVPFDLSKVLFVATANLLDPIPAALRDRMEIIHLPGYTEQEKIEIGKRFLIPKQMKNHGLSEKRIEITAEAMTELVRSYTKEAGVRNLEREIANVMRKVARAVAEGRKRKTVVDVKTLVEFLGPQRFEYGELEAEDQTGSATGLVVTEVGGDVVAIEVTKMEGKEDFILTGQLGEVMRESARAGLSWTRAHATELGISREIFEKNTLHIHVPAGGIPKDGPSAGITMATAIVSALAGIPVRKDVAMTGEITLRGRVLPIGGLKSKILAAHLAGARIVILPRKNEKDLRRHPGRDPQADQARPRRHDGPGPGGGPSAQAEGARHRAGQGRHRRQAARPGAGARGSRPPDDVPAGGPAAGRRPRRLGRTRQRARARDASRRGLADWRQMDYQDYYQTLGLTRNASQPEIKKAFRKLAREHHPDKRPGDAAAERRFKDINEAHAVLSDPEKRRKYDLLGANWESYSQAGAGGSSAGGNSVRRLRARGRPGGQRPLRVPDVRRWRGRRLLGLLPDVLLPRTNPAPRAPGGAGPAGGPTFEEILGQMGLERGGRTNGPAGRRPARCRRRPRKPSRRSASRRPSTARPGGSRSTASASR